METVSLRAYRIAERMDLGMISRLFYKKSGRIARYLHIRYDSAIPIPGLEENSQGVYLFSNGCAVFHGIGASATRDFLDFAALQGVNIDWTSFARYAEEITVEICNEEGTLLVERGRAVIPSDDKLCIDALATALARSVRLESGLDKAEKIYSKSDLLLEKMRRQKGTLSRAHIRGLADFLSMLKDSEYVAPPAGTPVFLRRAGICEEVYASAASVYRLADRYHAIHERNIHLRKTMKQYATLVHRREDVKAYIIEIILLSSFIIMDYLYYF